MRIDAVTFHPLKQRFTDLLTVKDLEAYFMAMSNYVQYNDVNQRQDTIIKMLKYSLANTKNVDLINVAVDILHRDSDLSECYRFLVCNKYFKRHAIDRIKQKDIELGTGTLAHIIKYDDDSNHKDNNSKIIVQNLLKNKCKVHKVGDVLYLLGESYTFTEEELYHLIARYKDSAYSIYSQVTPNLFGRILKGQRNIHMKYMYSNKDLFTEANIALMTKYIDNIRPYDFNKLKDTGLFNESRFKDLIGDKYYLLRNFDIYYRYSKEEIETIVYKYPKHINNILDSVKHHMMDEELCKAILINIKKENNSFLQVDFISTLVTWPGITEEIFDMLIPMRKVQTILLDSDFRISLNYTVNQHSADLLMKKKQTIIDTNLRLLFHLNKFMDMKGSDLMAVIDSFLLLKKSKEYYMSPVSLGSILKNKYTIDEDVIKYLFKLKYTDFDDVIKSVSNHMINVNYDLYSKCKKSDKKMTKFVKDAMIYIKSLT